ncbi:MAG: YtxH domain-containing protein [Anaerolineae bacterium]|nr:YtxH domain-containing protein [Anaerolineae bacterium]MDW8068221.1 YtxH domain-containing protein [Anaerolineae bacterium]
MRKVLGFLAGLLCGALVGALLGILLAPYAGAESRARLWSWVQMLIEKGQEAAAARRAELEAQLEAFKQGRPVVLQE